MADDMFQYPLGHILYIRTTNDAKVADLSTPKDSLINFDFHVFDFFVVNLGFYD